MRLSNKIKILVLTLIIASNFLPLGLLLAAPGNYTLLEPTLIGKSGDTTINSLQSYGGAAGFAAYFQMIYGMLMAIGVLTCIFFFVWDGFKLMVSEVPLIKIKAKDNIWRALEGLAFILGAYLILNTINPRLTHINLDLIQINSAANNDNVFAPSTNNVYDPPPAITNPCSDSNKSTGSYIISNEGWSNSQYTDSRGFPTIGVGHKIESGESFPNPMTDEQVAQLFQADYAKHYNQARTAAINNGVNFDALSPRRQTVITDMTFNLGAQGSGGLNEFQEMWAAMRTEDWSKAGEEIMDSEYAGQVGNRARANADIMRTDNDSYINQTINSNPKAKNYCK